NKSGEFVKVSPKSQSAALASVELPADLRAWIPDPTASAAYPIVTYTWLLCYKTYPDAKVRDALKSVIRYGFGDGPKFGDELGCIALPETVGAGVPKALAQIA